MPKRANDKANGVQKPLTLPEIIALQTSASRENIAQTVKAVGLQLARVKRAGGDLPLMVALMATVELTTLAQRLGDLAAGLEAVAAVPAGAKGAGHGI